MAMAFLVHVAVLSSLFPLSTAMRSLPLTGLLLEKDVSDSKPAHAEKPDVLDEHQQEHITEHHSSGLAGTVAKPVLANVLGDHVNPVKMPTVAQYPDKDLNASRSRSVHAEILHKVLEDHKQEHSKENHRTGLIDNKVKPVTDNDSTLEVNQVNVSAVVQQPDLNATSAHAPRSSGFAHAIPTALLMLFREPDHDVRTLRIAIIVLLLLVGLCGLCWLAEFFKARQNERHSLSKRDRRTSIASNSNASWGVSDLWDGESDNDVSGLRGSVQSLKALRSKIKRGYKSAKTAMSPGSSNARPEPEGDIRNSTHSGGFSF